MSGDRKWKRFEKLAYEIQRELAPTAKVTFDDKLVGHDSRTERQIDITVRQTVGQYQLLIAIECKDYSTPVDVKEVDSFAGMLRDVRAHKGALISANGFTEAALVSAKSQGIDAFKLIDTESVDWRTYIALPAMLCSATLQSYAISMQGRGYVPPFSPDMNVLMLRDLEGKDLGRIQDLVAMKWNESYEIPIESGEHRVLLGEGVLCEAFDNEWFEARIEIIARVKRRYFIGPWQIHVRGLKDEHSGGLIMRTMQTAPINASAIEQGQCPDWKEIDDPKNLAVHPVITLHVSNSLPTLAEMAKPAGAEE